MGVKAIGKRNITVEIIENIAKNLLPELSDGSRALNPFSALVQCLLTEKLKKRKVMTSWQTNQGTDKAMKSAKEPLFTESNKVVYTAYIAHGRQKK